MSSLGLEGTPSGEVAHNQPHTGKGLSDSVNLGRNWSFDRLSPCDAIVNNSNASNSSYGGGGNFYYGGHPSPSAVTNTTYAPVGRTFPPSPSKASHHSAGGTDDSFEWPSTTSQVMMTPSNNSNTNRSASAIESPSSQTARSPGSARYYHNPYSMSQNYVSVRSTPVAPSSSSSSSSSDQEKQDQRRTSSPMPPPAPPQLPLSISPARPANTRATPTVVIPTVARSPVSGLQAAFGNFHSISNSNSNAPTPAATPYGDAATGHNNNNINNNKTPVTLQFASNNRSKASSPVSQLRSGSGSPVNNVNLAMITVGGVPTTLSANNSAPATPLSPTVRNNHATVQNATAVSMTRRYVNGRPVPVSMMAKNSSE